jgi:hypothetical protein
MSYGRMKEKRARLEAEIAEPLQGAKETDEEEDRRYGKDRRGDKLPVELAFRESRLKKIKEAQEALEAEARPRGRKSRKLNPSGTSSTQALESNQALEARSSTNLTTARRRRTAPIR